MPFLVASAVQVCFEKKLQANSGLDSYMYLVRLYAALYATLFSPLWYHVVLVKLWKVVQMIAVPLV